MDSRLEEATEWGSSQVTDEFSTCKGESREPEEKQELEICKHGAGISTAPYFKGVKIKFEFNFSMSGPIPNYGY